MVTLPRPTEKGEAPVWQWREEGEYREYSTDEQRRQAGCIAESDVQRHFHHGAAYNTTLLDRRIRSTNRE